MLTQLLINGFIVGLVYGLIALGFVIIFKATGILNLAQGALLMLCGMVSWIFFSSFRLPFPLAFFFSLVVSSLIGITIERFTIRRLIGESLISVIILTLGLFILLRGIGMFIWGYSNYIYPDYGWLKGSIPLFGVGNLHRKYLFALVFSSLSLTFFALFFKFTKAGIKMRAISEKQLVAQSLGISVKRYLDITWAIGGGICGAVAGICLGFLQGINVAGTAALGFTVLPIAIIGGLESLPGAIAGGIIVGVVEQLSGAYLDPVLGAGTKELIPFIILLIVLMIRPYGLLGQIRIERL
jgi:branched-chain amino acid transport system permease protein